MENRRKTKEQLLMELREVREKLAAMEALEQRHRHELQKLDAAASFDNLTGLPTGSLFYNHLAHAVAHAGRADQKAAVLFCSLDRFKIVNDMFGSDVGDFLLKEVAWRFKDCLRKSDVLARPGRDEFMVLLPDIKRVEDVTQVVDRFFASLNAPFIVNKNQIFINTGVGVALYPFDGTTPEQLIKNSYAALERAREEGKNCCRFYSPAITDRAFKRLMMENSLRFALQRDEFYLHYQPQVDMCTGRMIGMEALLRWRHPELGLIGPSTFVPLMEEMGLIAPLTEWVLSTACSHNKTCQQANYLPMRVAVNLCSSQLHKEKFIKTIEDVLQETSLNPEFLELEITEGTLVSNLDSTVSILNALASMGISIAIDDFGKGYSSLAYLRHFPIDKLKIDRSFVDSLTKDSNSVAITRAIIALADSLDLGVIAEGVETKEQMDLLRALSCNEGQGYLFCHPLPAEEMLKLLLDKRNFDRRKSNDGKGQAPLFWLQMKNRSKAMAANNYMLPPVEDSAGWPMSDNMIAFSEDHPEISPG